MCATACPVLINTGDLTKRLRGERHGRLAQKGWKAAAKHWSGVTGALDLALDTAKAVPPRLPEAAARAARAVAGPEAVPRWTRDLPKGGKRRRPDPVRNADAVYVPSCLNTLFAPADGGPGVMSALHPPGRARGRPAARPGGDRRPVLRHSLVVQGLHRRP